ncbi:MAG: BMP family ABC transporter substrate-binding protein [Clostridium sp.]|uniref:BMP family lipoprotein n=1 Tax=Clostridium sp. TaxID=1506 RepID=UPI001ED7C8FD|nr:BMP family ABC transporter substrate-binding protein [Clostridium sp.]MBS5886416.1 BMP family ABC transporter substrate-binding protein [Clostridium sp.]MDU7149936.1 BMP family ABC transporter substrate-binding protein [Clostridium sp.]
MKKKLIALTLAALMVTGLVGCGGKGNEGEGEAKKDLKVGMVTDAGTIDDKSFNQGTWEGIEKAKADLKIESNYLKPAGTTEADYMKEIGNLFDTEYKFIVTPGFKFETAIFQAQDKYPDAKFVIIDGAPNNGKTGADRVEKVGDNAVAIFFAEHEAGFLAGVAASLQLKEGELGFIGGMEIPSVQKFNWGFQQGVKYANENLGTKMNIKAENVVYQGSFDNVAAGQQLAATMFDNGVKAIFTAAGGVGVGAINEAKTRATAGKEAWIVGVDVDQYADGIYKDDKSIILTSAMKKVDSASYEMVKAELDGKFPGGQTLTFDAKNDGIGIPKENPNLSKETTDKVDEIFNQIKEGKITVAGEKGDLIK